MNLRWTEPAARQLEQLHAYISGDNHTAAGAVAERIVDLTQMLAGHPQAGRVGRVPETREFAVPNTPYVIVYKIKRRTLFILAIYHGARKWPDHF
jgi:toxin ParE1/3/4